MVADLLLCGVLSTARYRLGGGVRESVGGVKRPTLERGRSGKLTVNLLLFGVPRTTGDVGHATRSLIGMASRLLSLYGLKVNCLEHDMYLVTVSILFYSRLWLQDVTKIH